MNLRQPVVIDFMKDSPCMYVSCKHENFLQLHMLLKYYLD